jgi:hypothetical protein
LIRRCAQFVSCRPIVISAPGLAAEHQHGEHARMRSFVHAGADDVDGKQCERGTALLVCRRILFQECSQPPVHCEVPVGLAGLEFLRQVLSF